MNRKPALVGPLWVYKTKVGPFYIHLTRERFHVIYDFETLDHFSDVYGALDALTSAGFILSDGLDTANLGISDDLADWEKLR